MHVPSHPMVLTIGIQDSVVSVKYPPCPGRAVEETSLGQSHLSKYRWPSWGGPHHAMEESKSE